MTDFKRLTADAIARSTNLAADEVYGMLEVPAKAEMGDYALPCFKLAKTLKLAPQKIADDLAACLTDLPAYISDVRSLGPYLNIYLNTAYFTSEVVRTVLSAESIPGQTDEGEGKTIIVEYSSPNIAKPFHLGHAFATFLGESLARLYTRLGYTVYRFNHLGDYGTQFGKLMVAYDLWCDEAALEQDPIKELTRIYVKFHQEAEERPELEDEARARFRRLEAKEAAEMALWDRFRDLSLMQFEDIYKQLGIQFDNLNGESFYSDQIPAVVDELNQKGLLADSRGAKVVYLEEANLPPALILKSDGATIYASRDIAAMIWRWKHYHFDKNIYVVGSTQSLHFQQFFEVARKMGYPFADDCIHVSFGTVRFPDAKFSTRDGNAILLEDLLRESIAKTKVIIEHNNQERGTDMSEAEIDEIAKKIGLAAVQYTFLKNGRDRDIIFSWDEILDFNGDTAPYLLYTYARAKSILRRADPDEVHNVPLQDDLLLLQDDEAFYLARMLQDFTEAVQQAVRTNEAFMVARHVSQLARQFNKYYNSTSILGTKDKTLRRARLALVQAVCKVLHAGLDLLGIGTVERM